MRSKQQVSLSFAEEVAMPSMPTMGSHKMTAHVTGFLYLLVVISGPLLLMYIPGKLFVSGDATATASNILAHETLYRFYVALGLVSELIFLSVVLLLYRLFNGVHRQLATVMVILILIDVPLAILTSANRMATLAFVRGGDFLAVFDKPQRDVMATFLINIGKEGVYVSEVFWGLWLLPLGMLVYRSGFLPRFIGIWLFANGVAYLVMSMTGILAPDYYSLVFKIALPTLFGEVMLMLWLLIRGVKSAPAIEPVAGVA